MSSMTMNLKPNVINVANYDLHSYEALDQTLINLGNTEECFNNIAARLDYKLNYTKTRLRNLEERVLNCHKKIEILSQLNVALTIYSPSKYIKPYKFDKTTWQESLFKEFLDDPNIPKMDQSILPLHQHTASQTGKAAEFRYDDYCNLINMLYVRLKQLRELFEGEHAIQNKRFEGLGRIPSNIKYIESLLVFNSKMNPYKHYTSFDNLQDHDEKNNKKKQPKTDEQLLTEAPLTLLNREQLQEFGQADFQFRPEVKQLAQYNMPDQLQLKGIVNIDNLSQSLDDVFIPSKGDLFKPLATIPDPFFNQQKPPQQPQTQPQQQPQQQPPPIFNQTIATTSAPTFPPTQQPPVFANPPALNFNSPQAPVLNLNAPAVTISPPVMAPQLNLSLPTMKPAGNSNAPQAPTLLDLVKKPLANQESKPPAQKQEDDSKGDTGAGRDALLEAIRNPNPMSRLRKVSTMAEEPKGITKGLNKPAAEPKKNEPKQSHLDYLKAQIQLRYQAINKKSDKTKKDARTKVIKRKGDSSEDEEEENFDSD